MTIFMDGMCDCDSFSVTDSLESLLSESLSAVRPVPPPRRRCCDSVTVTVTHGVMVADSIVFQTGYMLNIFLL